MPTFVHVIVLPEAGAVIVPPIQPLLAKLGVLEICNPAGNVSVKFKFVTFPELFGITKFTVSLLVAPMFTGLVAKDLLTIISRFPTVNVVLGATAGTFWALVMLLAVKALTLLLIVVGVRFNVNVQV